MAGGTDLVVYVFFLKEGAKGVVPFDVTFSTGV